MRWVLAGTVAGLLLGGAGLVSAQTRDVGTATISGRVIAAQGEGPLARAEVYLEDAGGYQLVLTDDQGRYAFTDLPARRYSLTAGRAGYVSIHYGQRGPEDPGEPIALGAGQTRPQVDFVLSRGAAIDATVIDEQGEPLEGVSVLALRQRPQREDPLDQIAPDPRPSPTQSSFQTDQRGRVRIYDLPPRDYYLMATTVDHSVLDDPPPVGRRAQGLAGYAPAFYPGTTNADEAQVVRLTAGQDVNVQMAIGPKAPGHDPNPPAAPLAPPTTPGAAVRRGRLTGRVLAADGSGPLVRAAVSLYGTPTNAHDGKPWWEAGGERATVTDSEGRFTFTGLPDGLYTLTAGQRGYRTRAYGQRPNEMPQLSIQITDGAAVDHVDIALMKAGALTVRITDEFGNPRAGVEVTVLQRRRFNGEPRLMRVENVPTLWSSILETSFTTDDRGEARAHDLPPGEYWVSAWLCHKTCHLMEAPETPHDQPLIYATAYYPGTTSEALAQPIAIEAGQEQQVSFALTPVRAARLSGVVLTSEGTRAHGQIVDLKAMNDGHAERTERSELVDGAFSFSRVPPGQYVIATPDDEDRASEAEFDALPIAVDGANLTDLVLHTAPRGTLRGHVVFESGTIPDGLAPKDITGAVFSPDAMSTGSFELTEDWSFTATGLRGPSLVAIGVSSEGWRLARVMLNGRNVTKVPLAEASDLEVVLSQGSTVTGRVVDSHGGPVLACPVLIFSEVDTDDPDNQVIEISNSGTDGDFRIQPLLPGRYFALALPQGISDTASDPESLARLERQATPFTIPDGEPISLSLTLTMAEQP